MRFPRPRRARHARLLILAIAFVACSDNSPSPSSTTLQRRLAVGQATTCALNNAGAAYCWGSNSMFWEYGVDAATLPSSTGPVAVPISTLASFSGGSAQHMCGIRSDHSATCWGRGLLGQLGNGALGNTGNAPGPVQGASTWSDIFVGRLTTCGLTVAGVGYCWGSNQRGEVGSASVSINSNSTAPVAVDGGLTFKAIVTGWLHACGITTAGAVYCWGDNQSGQLGIGTIDSVAHHSPVAIASTDQFIQLSLGAKQSCGITTDHRAICWGENGTGQLGDGTTTLRATPTAVAGGLKFTAIATGSGFPTGATSVALPSTVQGGNAHTCALTETGAPYCWGWNGAGQIGDSTTTDRLMPVAVRGGLVLTTLGAGGAHTCGMRGNAVWCWGSNFVGQLGNGATASSSYPVSTLSPFSTP